MEIFSAYSQQRYISFHHNEWPCFHPEIKEVEVPKVKQEVDLAVKFAVSSW